MKKTLGTRLGELRRAKNLKQDELAEQLGVSPQAVSKWENDQSVPDTYNLIALSGLLGLTVEYIATGAVPPEPPAPVIIPSPQRSPVSTQRIVGFILLGVGLMGILLGLLFSFVLAIASTALTLAAILCLTVKRYLGLVLTWIYSLIGIVFLSTLSGIQIFNPLSYVRSGLIWGLIGGIIWLLLLLAILFTARTIRHTRHKK